MGTEVYAYDFEIPVQSNVTGNNLILTVIQDVGENLFFENR